MAILDRISSVWNAFRYFSNQPPNLSIGPASYGSRIDRFPNRFTSERSIIGSIYTRISIDVATIPLYHVKVDDFGRYQEHVDSGLNRCLNLEPNMDQGPRAFRQNMAGSLFDDGVIAIVPVDTAQDPTTNEVFDIHSLRVGQIKSWHPQHVVIYLYNEKTGEKEEITLEKRFVAIVENPLYSVMNEKNSTLQRLITKLNLLDSVDDLSAGRLDMIIQLPYVIKSEARKVQAEKRREEIEVQLKGSQYGIAYTDGTEKITQLNRPADNQLLKQIEYLTNLLYNQLGITEAVMNGTADESAMLNYYNRTVEPIVDAIREAMERSFLGPMGVMRGERIKYYRDPFKLVPVSTLAEIADKFTRNEILTANEMRGFMGIAPAQDPKADTLMNSNMPQAYEQMAGAPQLAADPTEPKAPLALEAPKQAVG